MVHSSSDAGVIWFPALAAERLLPCHRPCDLDWTTAPPESVPDVIRRKLEKTQTSTCELIIRRTAFLSAPSNPVSCVLDTIR